MTAVAGDGSFAISYLPTNRPVNIDLAELAGNVIAASWFNPRSGETTSIGRFDAKNRRRFEPPGEGDWVLVLE